MRPKSERVSMLRDRVRHTMRSVGVVRQSVRVRLALWHTAALALVLFASLSFGYVYLDRTTREHGDKILADMLSAFVISWAAERVELPDASRVEAAVDAMQESRYRDRRLLLFSADGRLLLASDSTPLTPASRVQDWQRLQTLAGAAGVSAAKALAPTFTTIGGDDAHVRSAAYRITLADGAFTVVALRDLHDDDAVTESFLNWVMTVGPIALAFSAIGGYLIARQTLRPVVEMARASEQISARSLDARLDIDNPHDELGQLAGVLNRLLGRLEVSFDQQRQFMADASHELRSPVAVLYAAADIALAHEARPTDELRLALSVIRGEGKRMTRIVDDLFLLARTDTGQQPLHRRLMYLEEVLHEVSAAARLLALPRGIVIVCRENEESPFVGDALLLTRVVMNLLDNAIRHTPAGGVIHVWLLHTVDDADAPRYQIVVEDTGSGISAELQPRIFERFVRADVARTRDASTGIGAGLGLSIARWIAEAHRGSLTLRQSSTAGSSFVLELPAVMHVDAGNGESQRA